MKHTIKTRNGKVMIDTYTTLGEVLISVSDWTGKMACVTLTKDELGAVLFGLEQSGEALEVDAVRVACKGNALCSVPSACPTPIACGVDS